MKNVICVLLMCAFAAPVMSQRVKQDRKHGRKHVEAVHKKADVKKGCSKCDSLKKELETLKKRVASSRKTTSRSSKRGSRRGSSQRAGSSKKDRTVRRGGYGRRLDTEYENKMKERLKKAVESKRITKEQAAKIMQSRKKYMDSPKKKEVKMPVIPVNIPESDVRRFRKVFMDAIYQGRKYS